MRRILLAFLVIVSLFIGACSKQNTTVQVEPTVEQTVEVVETISLGE